MKLTFKIIRNESSHNGMVLSLIVEDFLAARVLPISFNSFLIVSVFLVMEEISVTV